MRFAVCVCCFFFVKQKTAYEMRISDWSSDVCSSDLLDLVLVGEAAQPPVAKLLDFGKYRFELQQQTKEARKRSRQQEMKSIKFRVKIDDHDYETKEIGRASGRERVCQSV